MSSLSVDMAIRGAGAPLGGAGGSALVKQADPAVGGGNSPSSKSVAPSVSDFVTSPKGVVDPQSGVFVLQYRDGDTGEVTKQYPSAKVVDAYKHGALNGAVAATSPAVMDSAAAGAVTTGGQWQSGSGGSVSGAGVAAAAPSMTTTASVAGTTSTVRTSVDA